MLEEAKYLAKSINTIVAKNEVEIHGVQIFAMPTEVQTELFVTVELNVDAELLHKMNYELDRAFYLSNDYSPKYSRLTVTFVKAKKTIQPYKKEKNLISPIEARMDLRVEQFSKEMQSVISELKIDQANRDAQINSSLANVSANIESLKSIKSHIWFGVATVVASLLASLVLAMREWM